MVDGGCHLGGCRIPRHRRPLGHWVDGGKLCACCACVVRACVFMAVIFFFHPSWRGREKIGVLLFVTGESKESTQLSKSLLKTKEWNTCACQMKELPGSSLARNRRKKERKGRETYRREQEKGKGRTGRKQHRPTQQLTLL